MDKHIHRTYYRLVDGTQANPDDVAPDKNGVLRHKNGIAVALRDSGVPQTLGVESTDNKNVEAAAAGKKAEETVKAQNAAAEAAPETDVAGVQTEIDPATGKKTEPEKKARSVKSPRNREVKAEKENAKKYKTR